LTDARSVAENRGGLWGRIGKIGMASNRFILALSCPDRVGIVAAVSSFFARHNGWIVESQNHADPEAQRFFLRQETLAESLPFGIDELRRQFEPIARQFEMTYTISDSAVRKRLVILVSKETHCLDDLLYRWRSGELSFDLKGVISNHEQSRAFVEWHKTPFHYVPMEEADREAAFRQVERIIDAAGAEVIVLARFMRILPPWLCQKFPARIINIHHSFLPSFVGSQPYRQAHERGVKFVGATCHYVTEKLDAGPIIEQDAFRSNHADTVEKLIRTGRDVEKAVLARGLRYHLEDRVLLNGNKTVVFD
jgi:formyltetrahydrofolate deformylase